MLYKFIAKTFLFINMSKLISLILNQHRQMTLFFLTALFVFCKNAENETHKINYLNM
jgi:uncharacterized membrane protein